MQQPVDIAKSVLFLASDAASEITGEALNHQRRPDHLVNDDPSARLVRLTPDDSSSSRLT
ncbi:hypothetical protein [Pseudonocardia charpentierae]|uniref:Short chain dehydrogenase n=1 Tax=Pseudonocardia charpentierae TaxID=3075545 RepID=A0ABU2NKS0_9PSEU|nr:hypothetical protein [Pseudonocardia sp. DSM 45834]MDT0354043.1 hypothetical protein [Pseudonocardia sp. DSM 45834]